ncbi:MAG: acetyltransferase [Chlorobi bacterium]|nr:acetyltransferase [Chlorobiota bacterium]
MNKVVVFGTGNQAKLMHYLLANDSEYEVVAFSVESKYISSPRFLGLPNVPFEEITDKYPPAEYKMFIALGAQDRNELRERVFYNIKEKGYTLVSYISSKAQTWPDLIIGENVFILQATSIEPFVEIGNNVVLIGTQIGQNVKIEDNCFISTATIGSDVLVGRNTFIGINALVNPYIKIGIKSVIGSGAIITRDVDDYSVYSSPSTSKSRVKSQKLRIM